MHPLIMVPEAADLLGITVNAIRDAVQRGDIIGGKLGGWYIVSRESAAAYRPRVYRKDSDRQEQVDARQVG